MRHTRRYDVNGTRAGARLDNSTLPPQNAPRCLWKPPRGSQNAPRTPQAIHQTNPITLQNCLQEACETPATRSQRTLKTTLTHDSGTVAGWAEGHNHGPSWIPPWATLGDLLGLSETLEGPVRASREPQRVLQGGRSRDFALTPPGPPLEPYRGPARGHRKWRTREG